jgi:hypothetical protein
MEKRLEYSILPIAEEFTNTVRKYRSFYKSSEYRLLSVKVNGKWTAISGVLKLSYEKKKSQLRELFSIHDRLVVTHKVEKFDVNSITEVIENLGNGRISLDEREIFLSAPLKHDLKNKETAGWSLYDLRDPEGWPANVMLFTGKGVGGIVHDLAKLTEQMKIHQPDAYTGLPQLNSKLVGFPIHESDGSRIYVIAPFYKKLENIRLTPRGELTGTFAHHESLKPSDFRVTIFYYSGSEDVDNFPLSFRSSKGSGDEFKTHKIHVTRNLTNITDAHLHLVHDNKRIQTYYTKVLTLTHKDHILQPTSTPIKNISESSALARSDEIDLVNEITDALHSLNTVSQNKFGFKIFMTEAKILNDLKKPIVSREGFVMRILGIATIIDGVFVNDIKKNITTNPQSGSINLLEAFFREKKIKYNLKALKTLRNLHALRNTISPIHNAEHKSIPILKDLGIIYPPPWVQAGKKCLKHFLNSINALLKNIR